jgi:SAM-dependent methyltransferase
MTAESEEVIRLYERHAADWVKDRGRYLLEKVWLDRFLALLPSAATVLDLGCGHGEPIAGYLIGKGCRVTGVDSSPSLVGICRDRFPGQEWIVADMRSLSLDRQFDGILAWDSFFHLCHEDQERMFPIFGEHSAPNTALMFTSGGRARGEVIATYHGEPLYHASLDEAEYHSLLDRHHFRVASHVVEDPDCGSHNVWLAQKA